MEITDTLIPFDIAKFLWLLVLHLFLYIVAFSPSLFFL